MGKIIKLKNKKTGERVYPVTATKAVVDADSGERLNDVLQNKVEEAPMDGKQYARVNKAWAELDSTSAYETALISITPVIAELNGVTVKVTTNEGETLLDTIWEGAIFSVQVREGLQYTIEVGSKEGFVAPQNVTHTATKGATRSINMAYTESRLKVNILSNQEEDSAISGVKATVKYGSTSVQVANGGIVNLPLNVDVNITFPDVTGYKKPETISFKHISGNYEKTGLYQTEIISVNLSADDGQDVNGQIVTINEIQHTWNGETIIQKVPYGVQYSVSVNKKYGYETPETKVFTSGQVNRNYSIIYKVKPMGIFIQGVSGTLYQTSQWNSQEAPNGVAVFTDDCSFVIALQDASDSDVTAGNDVTVKRKPNVTLKNTLEEAILDFSGKKNTDALIKAYYGYDNLAVHHCNSFIFPNGENGYLGSCGEWNVIYNNKTEILEALTKAGGSDFSGLEDSRYMKYYWTSTIGVQVEEYRAWEAKISENNRHMSIEDPRNASRVRALCAVN